MKIKRRKKNDSETNREILWTAQCAHNTNAMQRKAKYEWRRVSISDMKHETWKKRKQDEDNNRLAKANDAVVALVFQTENYQQLHTAVRMCPWYLFETISGNYNEHRNNQTIGFFSLSFPLFHLVLVFGCFFPFLSLFFSSSSSFVRINARSRQVWYAMHSASSVVLMVYWVGAGAEAM